MGIQTTLRATSTTVTTLQAAAMQCRVMFLYHSHLLTLTASPWDVGGAQGQGLGPRASQGVQEGQWEDASTSCIPPASLGMMVTSPGMPRMLITPVLAPSWVDEPSPGSCPALGAAKLDTPSMGNGSFCYETPPASEAGAVARFG